LLRVKRYAAWELLAIFAVLKYRSNVLVAASNTNLQSEHAVKCSSISFCTGAESFPSKYMQIK